MREKIAVIANERKLLVGLILIAGFTAFGPFGTYELLSFWSRAVFWSLVIPGIGLIIHITVALALPAPALARLPRGLRIGLGVGLGAIPGVAVVIFVYRSMINQDFGAEAFPYLWVQVTSIAWVAALFEYRAPARPEMGQGKANVRTRLHKRLPEGEEHDIISISMSDHYAEVTTRTGAHLVLLRMADAIEELEGLPGLRIHRSHWIAQGHLEDMTTRNRKAFAVLSDGRQLPVSKTYLEEVTAALA